MSEKIEIDVDVVSLMPLRDQGTFFIEHFDECLDDPKYAESVKRWAKKILSNDDYSTSNISSWNISFPRLISSEIVEIKSKIPLVNSEENEMLKFLEKVNKDASKNEPMWVNNKDDCFKNATWLYENGYLNGENNKADDDEYYMFFLTSVTTKGKTALKNESIY